ncbi:MAG: DUF4830 domain-containing protein [Clostridia bacterium]|nr:DUF4830 domain-containing protein [Clostridia bacterium]
MFVVSIKTTRKKLFAAAGLIALCLAVVIISPVASSQASASLDVNYSAANSQERIAFLSQFGWQVNEEPTEVVEVIIPDEFSDVYEKYNQLQQEQGFNLKDYCGKRVKRWTYQVINYPSYEGTDLIFANVLIYEGKVVGGDICDVQLDGFMHGFNMPENVSDNV